ncbi:hypothetical protein [Pandoraea apista]|uniref:hypothetical protein n=1 Tax=Pandoraea apista TaxID=93218 RepID=UPI00058A91A0|nr:hypothetical protein [Pandoraea apista]AJE98848.1 hypothetical protein SG18_12795 [Pandoraea apista]AKH72927.1 hypothetical protein XM39_12990 [Pandoraea apista]AKI61312.1 hypothetical protein AA956_05250 [Pandoraea apista]
MEDRTRFSTRARILPRLIAEETLVQSKQNWWNMHAPNPIPLFDVGRENGPTRMNLAFSPVKFVAVQFGRAPCLRFRVRKLGKAGRMLDRALRTPAPPVADILSGGYAQ